MGKYPSLTTAVGKMLLVPEKELLSGIRRNGLRADFSGRLMLGY